MIISQTFLQSIRSIGCGQALWRKRRVDTWARKCWLETGSFTTGLFWGLIWLMCAVALQERNNVQLFPNSCHLFDNYSLNAYCVPDCSRCWGHSSGKMSWSQSPFPPEDHTDQHVMAPPWEGLGWMFSKAFPFPTFCEQWQAALGHPNLGERVSTCPFSPAQFSSLHLGPAYFHRISPPTPLVSAHISGLLFCCSLVCSSHTNIPPASKQSMLVLGAMADDVNSVKCLPSSCIPGEAPFIYYWSKIHIT